MRGYRLSNAPRSLRRSTIPLDNLALVPASLLPVKPQWQAIANDLPDGDVLIILPSPSKQQRIARVVASRLREQGRVVRVMDHELHENAL